MTVALLFGSPLDFARDRTDLPCQQPDADPEWWFPVGTVPAVVAASKALCRPCPVKAACADYAVTHHMAGIWGGTDEDDRGALRRRRTA
jgi:WhiB family transcriptional regulator, redox-sensing transcriptional regulator